MITTNINVELLSATDEELQQQIVELKKISNLKIVFRTSYYERSPTNAEHPRDAGKAPDAKEPDLPSGSVRSPWSPGPGPTEIG